MLADAPPPYFAETDRVQDVGRVIQLTFALYKKLDLLPGLLVKIDKSSLASADQQALESLQNGVTAIPSTYSRSFINVRKLAIELEHRIGRFLARLDIIHNPELGKSDLENIFKGIIRDTKFDPETLKRDMTEFEVIAGKVNDLSNQSADLVLSGVQGIIARRNAIDDKARLEKANLHDLEKKLANLSGFTGRLRAAETHNEEKEKLKHAIADSKAKIQQFDSEVERLYEATATIRAVGDQFNSDTKDIISSLNLGPKEIASIFTKIYAQLAIDAKGFLHAVEHDIPVTEDTISNAKAQYNQIKDALHTLATK